MFVQISNTLSRLSYLLAFLVIDRYSVLNFSLSLVFFSSIALYYGESTIKKHSFHIDSIYTYTYIYLLLLCVFQTLIIFSFAFFFFFSYISFHFFFSCNFNEKKQNSLLFSVYIHGKKRKQKLTEKTFRTYL
jgi:hypothetical protein